MSSSLEIVSMLESRLAQYIEVSTGRRPSMPIHLSLADLQSRELFDMAVTALMARELLLRDHLSSGEHAQRCSMCQTVMDQIGAKGRARGFISETIEQLAEVRLLRGH